MRVTESRRKLQASSFVYGQRDRIVHLQFYSLWSDTRIFATKL